ncbi:MAG: hypothetical protein IKR57_03955 [Bacilli bacterium]|nr:hypothetical protein [Bacilli bacterium]
MRYIIIFVITLILSLFIIYYHPYLGKYDDQMTIEYNFYDDGYSWKYDLNNDNVIIDKIEDSKWVIKPNKNGKSNIVFTYYSDNNIKYEIFYELKVKDNKIYWLSGYGNGLLSYPNPY